MRSFPISPKVAASPAPGDTDFDLLQVLDILRRGKWVIMAWMLGFCLLAGIYVFRIATPLYTATATITLQNRTENIVDLASPLSGLGNNLYTINTEAETLASRGLATKLVDKLNLVADPVFNPALRPASDSALSPGAIIGWILSPLIPEDGGLDLSAEEKRQAERDAVIDTVMEAFEITNENFSYVFDIIATTEHPATSARIANRLAQIYVEDQIAIKYEATEQATVWLNARVADLKVELETAENAVKAYAAETDLISPEALTELNRQLKDRRDRVLGAQSTADALQTQVRAMQTARETGDPARMAAAADDATLNQIVGRLNSDESRAAFDVRFTRVLERARFEARQAAAKVTALKRSVIELEAQVERQSSELLKLEQLEREAAASRQIYEHFLGRLKEISVQQGIHRADSRILSEAPVPIRKSSPRTVLVLGAALFLGMLVGIAMVILREMRQNGFRSPQDLESATGQTVFAQIPTAPVAKRRRLIRYLANKPASALAEAVRNLRTSVMLSNIDTPPRVIMVTSSLPGEGKTTQSLALAQSFASMDRRVLLIEGDIRRRMFREYFRLRPGPGLIRAVMQELPFEEVVHRSEELGIDVLPGEKSTVNAADFFSSARIQAFLDRARAEYDFVIIDTPPVLIVPDARVIGRLVDAVLYAVRWNRTTRTQVEEGLSALDTVDVKVSGLVLSQVDVRKAAYYGGRYREIYAAYGNKYYRN